MNPLSNPSYLLPPLVVLAVSLILIVVVWRGTRRSFTSYIFCGFLISIGLWSLLIYGMRSSPDVHYAVLWDRAVPAAGFAAYLLFYHFTRAYTNTRGQRYILVGGYLLLVLFASISPTDLVIKEMRLEYYGYAPIAGAMLLPFMIISILFLLGGGAYNFLKHYIASHSHDERNRILYLLIAMLFPILGAFLDGFSNLPPASIWCNLIFCIICTVVILKYHLLDIRIIIRKSLVYLLISAAVAIPYVSVLYSLHYVFETTMEPWWIHALILLLLAIILRPLYSLAQQFVDRLFYRDRYDYLRALVEFMQETHDVRDLNQLASSLVNLIGRALQSSTVQLLLSSASGDFVEVPPTGQSISRFKLSSHGTLLRWVQDKKRLLYRKDVAIIPQLQSLTRSEMYVLNNTGAELIVPILTKEKELIGLIILGEKRSQLEYSQEDERLVLAVANRMATELENARLYDLEKTARKELEKVDEQKTEFLHSVGHELKTPLTAIISSSEILSGKSSMDPSFKERLVTNIRRSAESMDRRVTELLALAEMQIGDLKIEPAPLEITRAIDEIASQLRILFEKKRQTLTLQMPSLLPKVNADRGKLEQVLFNLISNANKFSPVGTDIVLRTKVVDRKVIVEVEDSAPVVSEKEKNKLFDPYYRSKDADKRGRFPGLGLGLSISKKLVELHEGEIWVESKSGKGNIFAFSLPIFDRRTS